MFLKRSWIDFDPQAYYLYGEDQNHETSFKDNALQAAVDSWCKIQVISFDMSVNCTMPFPLQQKTTEGPIFVNICLDNKREGDKFMAIMRQKKILLACIEFTAALFLLILITGCGGLVTKKGEEATVPEDKGLAPPIYYDFGDVRVPEELKVDNKSSFVYRTAGFSAGVLVLEGRVEIYSLIGFFENSMVNDNWTAISSFKSPRTIMLFQKEDRWCVINITERQFTTHVEIWVAPTIHEE